MLSIYRRLKSLLERRRRARLFSIHYTRDQEWSTPRHLLVDGKEQKLSLPEDQGTAIAFKDIFISDVYGLETWTRPPQTVIDIGAHAGLFSLAARLYFPTAVIHSYEPNPVLWPSLESHAAIGKFTPIAAAVGSRTGRADLSSIGDSVYTQCSPADEGKIQVTSLEDAVNRIAGDAEVDLLKLDCEGAEWDILQDNRTMQRIAHLTMEYHLDAARPLDDLLAILKRLGFRVGFLHRDDEMNGRIWAARDR